MPSKLAQGRRVQVGPWVHLIDARSIDYFERAGGGRGLRAHRHHIQCHVLGLAGVQFHRGVGRHAGWRVRRRLDRTDGNAGNNRLSPYIGARRHSWDCHRDCDGASRTQEPGPASLRAVHARRRVDDSAADGDLLQHGCYAFSARHTDRVRIFGSKDLAADPGLHRNDHRAGISLPPHIGGACLSRNLGGQLRGSRARPSRGNGFAWGALRWRV